jgi:negative regulator of sigma E activity
VAKTDRYENLSAYLDGELPDAQRARVERLIATDPEARAMLDELRRVSSLTGSLPRSTAPVDTGQRVLAHLEREALLTDQHAHAAPRLVRLWRPIAIAASLAIVVTAGWYLRPESPHLARDAKKINPPDEQFAAKTEVARPAPAVMRTESARSSRSDQIAAGRAAFDAEAEDTKPMSLTQSAPLGGGRGLGDHRYTIATNAFAPQPASQPSSQPSSQPTSRPTSQPTTGKSP